MSCQSNCSGGIGIGTLLAVYLSWMFNHSIGYAVVHGILGWFYVIFYFLQGRAIP